MPIKKKIYELKKGEKILNINIAKCYHLWYTKSEVKFKNAYEKDLFYLCAAMVTDKEEEFKECLSKINTSRSIKEEMIVNMYKDNLPINIIAKYANLSIEKVNEIINSQQK